MKVIDPTQSLRVEYSGFKQWLHVISLLVFLAPYIVFVIRCLMLQKWLGNVISDNIPMWRALLRFVWSGGKDITSAATLDLLALTTFILLFVYNVFRAVLLWKIKQIELDEQISGLPSDFTPTGYWEHAIRASSRLFYGSIVLVALHTWRFLLLPVPLPQ